MRWLRREWRRGFTGLAFLLAGLGGLVLSLLVFPLARLVIWNREAHRRFAQDSVRLAFGVLVLVLGRAGVMRLETRGLEGLRSALATGRGALILANHPTFIDIVVLLALLPRATCVVKRALWRDPFYGGIVRATGYLANDDPEHLIAACAGAVRSGQSLIIFPEGTRSTPGKTPRFLRGAARVALESGCEIFPVLIECDPSTLTKGSHWYQIPERAFRLRVDARPALQASALIDVGAERQRAARELTRRLEQYFTGELQHHGCA